MPSMRRREFVSLLGAAARNAHHRSARNGVAGIGGFPIWRGCSLHDDSQESSATATAWLVGLALLSWYFANFAITMPPMARWGCHRHDDLDVEARRPNSTLRSSIKSRATRLLGTNHPAANVGPPWRIPSVESYFF
jgi:hypothetical protein